ncbi:hypothetical protein [Providencia sp. Me31A]|uniref:hypothetical protein n=1 Tax=Providencia sp. Me31A TaxID=3392637 RepID=UPI003D2BD83D
MSILSEKKNRLLNIKWFANIGQPLKEDNVISELSLDKANILLASPEWESVTLEESNKISSYLTIKHNSIFQEWNIVAKEAKKFFDENLKGRIPAIRGFDNILLIQCLQWDLAHYLIESYYSSVLKKSLFFEQLIVIYELGHIPCGWEGNWPSGKIIVY